MTSAPPPSPAPDAKSPVRPRPTNGAEIGALIGGAFGLLSLIVNSAGFSIFGRITVFAIGIIAFAAILVLAFRSMGRRRRGAQQARGANPFGRSYWIIVVVGTHFFAFGIPTPAFIPVLAGVIPGFVLLAFGLWALAPVESQRP